jgi:hypothetical protein
MEHKLEDPDVHWNMKMDFREISSEDVKCTELRLHKIKWEVF